MFFINSLPITETGHDEIFRQMELGEVRNYSANGRRCRGGLDSNTLIRRRAEDGALRLNPGARDAFVLVITRVVLTHQFGDSFKFKANDGIADSKRFGLVIIVERFSSTTLLTEITNS